jgi:hypothetical protein
MTDATHRGSSYDIDLVDKAGAVLPSSQPNWSPASPSNAALPVAATDEEEVSSEEDVTDEAEDEYDLFTAAELAKITNDTLTETADGYFDEIMSNFNDKVQAEAEQGLRTAIIDEAAEQDEDQIAAHAPVDEANAMAWARVSEKLKALGFTTETVAPDEECNFWQLRARW